MGGHLAHLRPAPMGRPVVVQSAPIDYGRLATAIVAASPGVDPAALGAAVRDGAAAGTEAGMTRRARFDRMDARARTA
jgi:hypothetical protein